MEMGWDKESGGVLLDGEVVGAVALVAIPIVTADAVSLAVRVGAADMSSSQEAERQGMAPCELIIQ